MIRGAAFSASRHRWNLSSTSGSCNPIACATSAAHTLRSSSKSRRSYVAPAGGSSSGTGASSSGKGGSSSTPSSSAAGASSSSSSSSAASKKLSKASTAYQRQSRTEWGIVAVAGAGAAVGAWYYWWQRPRLAAKAASQHPSAESARNFSRSRTTFSIAARGGGGQHKIIQSLTPQEVDRALRDNERSTKVERRSCLVARYDTNSVASNDPIEDKRAEAIVERDLPIAGSPAAEAVAKGLDAVKGDLCFFAVMDGHAGYATSTLLSQKLIAFVALELDKVFREQGEYGQIAKAKQAMPAKMWNYIFGGGGPDPTKIVGRVTKDGIPSASAPGILSAGLDGDPEIVRRAIIKAFKGLDKEICNTPIELLKEYEISLAASNAAISSPAVPSRVVTASSSSGGSSGTTSPPPLGGLGQQTRSLSSLAHSIFPSSLTSGFTQTQKTAYEAILPALSGSCALLTYVDSARGDLYVACTGDSRAIAGWWREKEARWEIEPLSIDQTGRNEAEAKRMRAEHPPSESEHVIMRGRVLGGLEPTRAFGDARYKWDRSLQERLYDAFLPGGRASARPPPRYLQTPPYVTAEPVVEVRKISAGLAAGNNASPPERELKFIVMATDGLWDMMTNEEVGCLVAGHLAGLKGDVLADKLYSQCFPGKGLPALPPPGSGRSPSSATPPANAQGQPSAAETAAAVLQRDLRGHPLNRAPQHLKTFTFEDDNLSTHLIRNALGGGQRERVAGLLAIPAPESRSYRDDITVNVILFNDLKSANAAGEAQEKEQTPIKSKL